METYIALFARKNTLTGHLRHSSPKTSGMICKTASVTTMVTNYLINLSRKAAFLLARAAFIIITSISTISAGTQKIIGFKSTDLKPYQDVLRGLRDECSCNVREVKLNG
jgi:hypothetical protein